MVFLDAKTYTSGTTWKNAVGTTDATLTNAPVLAYDRLKFAGTASGQFATLPYVLGTTGFSGSYNYTIAAWVWLAYDQRTNANNFVTNNHMAIIEHWNINPCTYSLHFYAPYYNITPANANRIGFTVVNNAGTETTTLISTSTATERWVFACGTVDYTNGIMKLYVDGTQESQGTPPSGLTGQTWTPYIFARGNASNKTNGQLGMLMIYNRSLNAAEVSQLYTAHRPRFYG